MPHSDLPSEPGRTGTGRGWLRVALALFAVTYGTNVFTPLLVVYRRDLDLSATVVTTTFAVYAAGLLPAMLLAGPASDRIGRRRLVLTFAALAAAVSLLFVPAAEAAPLLYVARFLQGLVSGAVIAVASAWIADLTGRPDVAGRRTAVATTAGFSLGPLTSGLLGEYAPWPLTLPFLVHVGLVALALGLVWTAPEIAVRRESGRRLIDLTLPAGTRPRFWLVLVPTAVCVFSFPSTAGTVLPLLLPPGGPEIAQAGVVAGVTLAVAAVVPRAAPYLRSFTGPAGALVGGIGLGVTAFAGVGSVPVLVVAAVLLGCGAGLTLTAGLTLAQQLSTEGTRGALSSAFYSWAYAGFALPVVITVVADGGSLTGPLAAMAMVFVVLAGLLAADTRRRDRVAALSPTA